MKWHDLQKPLSFPEVGLLLAPRASKLPYKPLTGSFWYSYFLIQTEEDCYNGAVFPPYRCVYRASKGCCSCRGRTSATRSSFLSGTRRDYRYHRRELYA